MVMRRYPRDPLSVDLIFVVLRYLPVLVFRIVVVSLHFGISVFRFPLYRGFDIGETEKCATYETNRRASVFDIFFLKVSFLYLSLLLFNTIIKYDGSCSKQLVMVMFSSA